MILLAPWKVASPNFSNLVFASDFKELSILNASIDDRLIKLKSDITVSRSESNFRIISLILDTLSLSSEISTSTSFFNAAT